MLNRPGVPCVRMHSVPGIPDPSQTRGLPLVRRAEQESWRAPSSTPPPPQAPQVQGAEARGRPRVAALRSHIHLENTMRDETSQSETLHP